MGSGCVSSIRARCPPVGGRLIRRDGKAPGGSTVDQRDSLNPGVVADLIAWMATAPGEPVLNEVTMTPLREGGWP